MDARDAVSNTTIVGTNSVGGILLTNSPGLCAKLTAGQQLKNVKAISIGIGTQRPSGISAPVATGTYTVYSQATIAGKTGTVATAFYLTTGANCSIVSSLESVSGTVTLTRIDSNGYAGTFDITFSDTSHATGSFAASNCAGFTSTIDRTCP